MAVLPCVEATRCLFRTRGFPPQAVVQLDEIFGMQISHGALRQKTLRVDVCHASASGHEECLVSGERSAEGLTYQAILLLLLDSRARPEFV